MKEEYNKQAKIFHNSVVLPYLNKIKRLLQ
jgi:hypothetical protein